MSVSITSQPAANSLNAAYRPIIVSISGTNPVVYCDIYFNGIYYKTVSKTQGLDFDIQNAAKEYLKKFLAPNGGTSIVNASPVITSCYVKVRGSVNDANGFLQPDAPIPVQGTDTVAPIAGGGTQSNTFYIINSALQQEDNQNLASHLAVFKSGTWDANTFPLTHRPQGYQVNKLGSDYFPIVSNSTPSGITLHYHLRSTGQWLSTSGGSGPTCVPVSIAGTLPDGTNGVAYSYSIALSGTAPFSLASIVKPAWMTVAVSGGNVTFTGTPNTTGSASVSFVVNNACGSDTFADSINIAAGCIAVGISGTPVLPDAQDGVAYSYSFSLTGTAPFTLASIVKPAWMTIAVSGSGVNFSGTPATGDVATGVAVSFTINNACGSVPFSDTIDVASAPPAGTTYDIIAQPAGGNSVFVYCFLSGINTAAPFTTDVTVSYSYTPTGGGSTVNNTATVTLTAGSTQVLVATVTGAVIDATVISVVPSTDGTDTYTF